MATIGRSRVEGVGVTYHPFLHDYLLERVDLFDFIELPLDLYADSARSALLDPGQMRLRQVIAAKPCTWRGSALAIGSVERGFQPYGVQTLRRLLDLASGAPYTEVIGFRVPGPGGRHAVPFTPTAASWIAQRQAEAQHVLGVPVRLTLPHPGVGAGESRMDAAEFLALIMSYGGHGLVVDAADEAMVGLADGAKPAAPISALALSSDDAGAWGRLCTLATHLRPQTIILSRDRQLFPLNTIERDLRRVRSLIAAPADTRPAPGATPSAPNHADAEGGLAALLDYQQAVTAAFDPAQPCSSAGTDAPAGSWQNWRNQVDDMHKAQQIAVLLSRSGDRGPAWRP